MLKALGFGKGPSSVQNSDDGGSVKDESKIAVIQEAIELEIGLKAMDLVMDDRPSEANKMLTSSGESTYSKLARGVINFIEATLGFEPEAIRIAVDSLYEAEQTSHRARQRSHRNHVNSSSLFPPGTEYALTMAEANLLGAISLFLSESVIDSAKAFYKLRKAYQILDEISHSVNASDQHQNVKTNKQEGDQQVTECNDTIRKKTQELKSAKSDRINGTVSSSSSATLVDEELLGITVAQQSVDEFIKSGVDAMFGLLQLVISIIPPTLGRVLSLVGFRGDKEQGLKMLWRASSHSNIHGALALLALLQFYDGPTQFSDIELPHESNNATSSSTSLASDATSQQDMNEIKQKLENGLDRIRHFYPRGALWQLQEGRMVGSKGDLERAVQIMDDTSNGPIEMKQVEGLMLFDKTIMLVSLHEFETSATNFIKLIDLNSWSHAFYYYLSGVCHVEVYRRNKTAGNLEKAEEAKQLAKEAIEKAPTMFGKKRFMAKTMPFDVFVLRKINQWKAIASSENVDLIDAIGTSPIHEINYFWNGFNRMSKEKLQAVLEDLEYTSDENNPPVKETEDESLIRHLLQSVALRFLGQLEQGQTLLEEHVLNKVWTPTPSRGHKKSGLPKGQYHKHHKDQWIGPSALYERGIFEWKINGADNIDRVRDYLELATGWADDYELSTRVGIRIKSATDRLDNIEKPTNK